MSYRHLGQFTFTADVAPGGGADTSVTSVGVSPPAASSVLVGPGPAKSVLETITALASTAATKWRSDAFTVLMVRLVPPPSGEPAPTTNQVVAGFKRQLATDTAAIQFAAQVGAGRGAVDQAAAAQQILVVAARMQSRMTPYRLYGIPNSGYEIVQQIQTLATRAAGLAARGVADAAAAKAAADAAAARARDAAAAAAAKAVTDAAAARAAADAAAAKAAADAAAADGTTTKTPAEFFAASTEDGVLPADVITTSPLPGASVVVTAPRDGFHVFEAVPTWVWVGGGLVLVGGIAYYAMRKAPVAPNRRRRRRR